MKFGANVETKAPTFGKITKYFKIRTGRPTINFIITHKIPNFAPTKFSITMHDLNLSYLNKAGRLCLAIAVIIVSILPGLLILPHTLNFFDEPYQILNGVIPANAPYSPLSAHLTALFGRFFDWNWLCFKYLAIILNICSILIACSFLYFKTRKLGYTLIFTSVSLFIGTVARNGYNMYGWDDWTQVTLVVIILSFLNFIDKRSIWKIVAVGVLSGILIMLRLPNIAIIPIIIVTLCFLPDKFSLKLCYIALYLVSAALAAVIIILLSYGGIANYIDAFGQNPLTAHGVEVLVSAYRFSLFLFIPVLFIVFVSGYLSNKICSWGKIWVAVFGFLIIAGTFMWCLYFDRRENIVGYLFGMSLVFYLAGVIIVRNRKRVDRRLLTLKIVAIALLACVPFCGSNTGFIKFITWSALPLLAVYLRPYINKSLLTVILAYSAGILMYSYYRTTVMVFYDHSVLNTDYKITKGKMEGMITTRETGEMIENTVSLLEKFPKQDYKYVIVRFENHYIWEYLLDERNDFLRHQFDFIDRCDREYSNWIEKEITQGHKPVVLLYETHPYSRWPDSVLVNTINRHLEHYATFGENIIYTTPSQNKH